MGRYIEWDDIIDRYPELNTLGGSDELSPTFIDYAESFTDALLKSHFTVPFSNNNMVVKDLCIDCVYWRAGRHSLEDAASVRSEYFETINMLKEGQLTMMDDSGNEVGNKITEGYSNTESYHSSFGMDDVIWHRVSSLHMADDQDARS
jgi:phage gp36-like protein